MAMDPPITISLGGAVPWGGAMAGLLQAALSSHRLARISEKRGIGRLLGASRVVAQGTAPGVPELMPLRTCGRPCNGVVTSPASLQILASSMAVYVVGVC